MILESSILRKLDEDFNPATVTAVARGSKGVKAFPTQDQVSALPQVLRFYDLLSSLWRLHAKSMPMMTIWQVLIMRLL